MTNIHYHVMLASNNGVVLRDQPFDDGTDSIRFFMTTAESVFDKQIGDSPGLVELAMIDRLSGESEEVIYVEYGSLRILWAPCPYEKCPVFFMWN